ncbi:citrate transporter [Enterococcus timonensis]|uniref:citrate transporter n=1 Tax=Enterococcus timonensis TaxID=1852364 RepID=UPI0008D9BED2|nr:citrate transporter [Enterococcus timonensis]
MVNVIIGLILIASFVFMVWYCVKGYNLMVGFFIMATVWTLLAVIGNFFDPSEAMKGRDWLEVLTFVYADGPAEYSRSILVNVFFGAFFGRVLVDTGIASTLIRKVTELGGDKPKITMALLCILTSVIFMVNTGIGPVISIAVIVIPILLSLGIAAPVALFAFMGSIMAGIFSNPVNFQQYQTIYKGFNEAAASYDFGTYFKWSIIATVVSLVVVFIVSSLSMGKKKSYAWAANAQSGAAKDAPAISWLAVILPVILVLFVPKGGELNNVNFPIIFGFIVAALWAMLFTGRLKGGFIEVCRRFAKLFTDGSIDVAPMIGFLLALAMFNNAATFAAPYFTAILGDFIPHSAIILAIVFGVLTPLGFFRGPLNLVGSGSAILAVVLAANPTIPVEFLFPLFAITTIAPQHLDITQSWVAWGFGYTKVASGDFMKKSIPTGWIIGIIMAAITYIMYGNLV